MQMVLLAGVQAYCSKGDYDRAIADYTEAIRLKPHHAIAYCGRGAVYGNTGEYAKAIADLTGGNWPISRKMRWLTTTGAPPTKKRARNRRL